MRQLPLRLSALSMLCLTACFGGAPATPSMISMSARNGARWSQELLETGAVKPLPPLRPSAMLGPYVAAFLSVPFAETSHAAVSGVLSGTAILFDEGGVADESYALLEELGLTLQVDLDDYLNRALDRQMALDTYVESLTDVATRAQAHRTDVLEQRQDDVDTEVRELRKQSSLVQRNLNDSLRAKDYASASSHQADLSEVQGELAVATSTQKEVRNITNLFEDSLELAAERVQAIDANREALLAGVSVTDIPGADDLGVIMDPERGRRRADPEDVFGPVQPAE